MWIGKRNEERLLGEYAGNPLAIIELTSALTAGQRAGREPIPSPVPLGTRLERTYLAGVRRMPSDTQVLLTVAAAIRSYRDAGEERAAARHIERRNRATPGRSAIGRAADQDLTRR
jgi:hypothetical protein